MVLQQKPKHPNLLSPREKESLAAICDTLFPSVDVSSSRDDDLIAFYGTSASMLDLPDKVGRLLSGEMYHPACKYLRVALWFLSTWYGTFCMCGLASLSGSFPFFQSFAQVGQAEREQILCSWSCSSFYPFTMLFKCLKYVATKLYFSEVNEKNWNPSWRAIDYCGPDPAFVDPKGQQGDKEEDCVGPLHPALLAMDTPIELLCCKLRQAGFPQPTASSFSNLLTLQCDAVIVGSGSGGSVVAGILASAGHKVLVLEKGDYIARGDLSLLEGSASNDMYENKALIATDNLGVTILAGSTVGGGSTINWSACIRTPDHVRDEWRDKCGLQLFGTKVFDRALDAVCDKMGVQSDCDEEGFNCSVLRRGCEELGYRVSRVPCNAPPDHYCGWCHMGCKSGKKKSTQETWLKDLAESGNGLILPGCRVVKIIRDGDIARGVVAETIDGVKQVIIESKVTVVACGALNTPGLLKRSGLKNEHIGENLHLHPCVMAWGYFPDDKPSAWPEASKKSYEGPILTSMSDEVANFGTSGYGTILQTPILHPGMFAVLTPWTSSAEFRERMLRFSRTAHLFALARDKGRGSVDYPWKVTYELDRDDEENLVKGLEAMLRVLVAAGAEEVGTLHCSGERISVRGNDKGLERLIEDVRRRGVRDLSMPVSSAHQMGSCRMGARPEEGAVRPSGEMWEVEGLFVADTSVFPTALGVNPMVTVQAIAYCTAQSVLQALKKKKKSKGEEKANGFKAD